MRIGLLADTHMPRGSRRIPDRCVDAIRDADLIIHAGDFSGLEVVEWLAGLGPAVRAVYGNVDRPEVRARLPERDSVSAAGARIGLVHDAGPAPGRLARLRRWFPQCDAVVFGHSHMPLHESVDDFQIFNPGSPTERRRAPRASFGLATVRDGAVEFEHVWL